MKTIGEIERQTAGDRAATYFGNGFHCAEAVATAVLEAIGENPAEAAAHATAFGGGFGRTFQEACGALSGALVAIGHIFGRRKPGGEWDFPARLGAQIRQYFLDEFKTTHCATLRQRFGEEQQMARCRKLTESVTTALLVILTNSPIQEGTSCCEKQSGTAKKPAGENMASSTAVT